jgi:hypothetical protein
MRPSGRRNTRTLLVSNIVKTRQACNAGSTLRSHWRQVPSSVRVHRDTQGADTPMRQSSDPKMFGGLFLVCSISWISSVCLTHQLRCWQWQLFRIAWRRPQAHVGYERISAQEDRRSSKRPSWQLQQTKQIIHNAGSRHRQSERQATSFHLHLVPAMKNACAAGGRQHRHMLMCRLEVHA